MFNGICPVTQYMGLPNIWPKENTIYQDMMVLETEQKSLYYVFDWVYANLCTVTVIDRVRTKLESPWMSLNLKTKIQGLECPWICKEVLECPWILLALVFGYFLKLFDIQDGHFVELILHVHIWPHYKVTFWTIQRQILLISNAFSSVFSPWICWYTALNVLEKSLNLTLPHMYEPWIELIVVSYNGVIVL
jgi:hypothetical protein